MFFRPRLELNVTIKYHKNLIVNFQLITQSLSGQGRHRRKFCHQDTSAGRYSNMVHSVHVSQHPLSYIEQSTAHHWFWRPFVCKYRLPQWLTTFLTQLIISFFFITINNRTPIFHMIAGVRRNFSAKQESYFAKGFTIQQFIPLHRTHPSSNSLASTSDIYCKANFVQRCQIDISVLTVRNITSGSWTKRSLFTGRYADTGGEAWFNNSPTGKRESPPSLRP